MNAIIYHRDGNVTSEQVQVADHMLYKVEVDASPYANGVSIRVNYEGRLPSGSNLSYSRRDFRLALASEDYAVYVEE